MRRILRFGVLAICVGMMPVMAVRAQQTPEQMAEASDTSLLALIDSGKYAESWDAASAYFQAAVSKEKWKSALEGVRAPLGKVVSRALKGASFSKTLPGAPDGEYVVAQYATDFEHKQGAVETVVSMKEKDGSWKLAGYFIK